MDLDKTDVKIVAELLHNGRTPLNSLAKKVRVSREVLSYRLNRLIKKGIIKNFIADIDLEKLGFVGAAVFVATKIHNDKEFQEYLIDNPDICWVGEQIGIWNYGFSIYATSNAELDKKFLDLYTKFKDTIVNYRVTLHKKNTFLYDKFFHSTTHPHHPNSIKKIKLDDIDKKILSFIALDARTSCTDMAEKLKMTSAGVSYRLKQLEKAGIIIQYSAFIDFSKLGLYQYSIFIDHRNLEQKQNLIHYLESHKNVCFICEYSGEPFLEFGLFVSNPYELKNIFQELAENFPDFRINEISLQKDIVSIGPPRCAFD